MFIMLYISYCLAIIYKLQIHTNVYLPVESECKWDKDESKFGKGVKYNMSGEESCKHNIAGDFMPIILAAFLILTNLILFNLLIAMFKYLHLFKFHSPSIFPQMIFHTLCNSFAFW